MNTIIRFYFLIAVLTLSNNIFGMTKDKEGEGKTVHAITKGISELCLETKIEAPKQSVSVSSQEITSDVVKLVTSVIDTQNTYFQALATYPLQTMNMLDQTLESLGEKLARAKNQNNSTVIDQTQKEMSFVKKKQKQLFASALCVHLRDSEAKLIEAYGNLQRTHKQVFDFFYIAFANFFTLFEGQTKMVSYEKGIMIVYLYGFQTPDEKNADPSTIKLVQTSFESQRDLFVTLYDLSQPTTVKKKKRLKKKIKALVASLATNNDLLFKQAPQVFQMLMVQRPAENLSALFTSKNL